MTRINMASTRSSPFNMAIFGLVIFAALIPQASTIPTPPMDEEPPFIQPASPWPLSMDGNKTCEEFGVSDVDGSMTGFIIKSGGALPDIPTLSLDGTALKISMVDECLHFREGDEEGDPRVLSARTRLYKYTDPKTGEDIVAPYGPVIKIRPGCQFSLKMHNMLPPYKKTFDRHLLQENGFKLFNTGNLHTHGLHIDPGQKTQDCVGEANDGQCILAEGDNVFNYANPGGDISYHYMLPDFHLPSGTHWYHPHQHGSTAIQTATMHGIIDVEEPDAEGLAELLPPKKSYLKKECKALRNIFLDKERERIIAIEGMFWRKEPDTDSDMAGAVKLGDDSIPFMEALAQEEGVKAGEQSDPLLTFDEITGFPDANKNPNILNAGTTFQDFAILNGVYKPDIHMKLGKYYRLRLVNTMVMRWLDISIRKKGSTVEYPGYNYADPVESGACELWLLGYDGVFLPDLPRRMTSVPMTAGARADVLIRCTEEVDEDLVLVSGRGPQTPLTGCRAVHCELFGNEIQTNGMPYNPNLNRNRGELANLVFKGNGRSRSREDPQLVEEACEADYRPYEYLDQRKFENTENTVTQSVLFSNEDGSCALIYDPTGVAEPNINGTDPNNPMEGGMNFKFPDEMPISMDKRTVQQWTIGNADEHPYHVHVNHFQIKELPKACLKESSNGADRWIRVGDYHDTLQLTCNCDGDPDGPECDNLEIGQAQIRFFAADFGGRCPCPDDCTHDDDGYETRWFWNHGSDKKESKIPKKCNEFCRGTDRVTVMHCHFLAHEDEGCMKVMEYTCPEDPEDVAGECLADGKKKDYNKGGKWGDKYGKYS